MAGLTHIIKPHISSVKDADLPEEEILDYLTLLLWYIHRFWTILVCNIFSATNLITETYPQLMDKIPEALQHKNASKWFPDNFVTITEAQF